MKKNTVKTQISRNRPAGSRAGMKPAAKPTVKAVPQPAAKSRARTRRKAEAKPVDPSSALLREIHEIRSLVSRSSVPQPVAADAALEGAVDSVRRLLSELIETRMDSLLRELAGLRQELQAGDPARVAGAAAHLDQILENLGAQAFAAARAEYVDPLIHTVVGECYAPGLPRAVIVETVRKGYRTGRGVVLSRAGVIINRGN